MQQAANDRLGAFGAQFGRSQQKLIGATGYSAIADSSAELDRFNQSQTDCTGERRLARDGPAPSLQSCGKPGHNVRISKSGTGFGQLSFSARTRSARANAKTSASGRTAHIAVYQVRRCERRRPSRLKPRQHRLNSERSQGVHPNATAKRSASSLMKAVLIPPVRPDTFCMAKTGFRRAQDHRRLPSARPHHATRVRPRCGPSSGQRRRRI
jgi:hypothetical protein